MRKRLFAIIFSIVIFLNLISLVLLPITYLEASTTKNSGFVQIKVLEANTLKPIANATVCIIETHNYNLTNESGDTIKIEVPIMRNTNFDDSLLRDWGEFTLLIYKQGYASHISFYNEVYAGITRVGIICYLTPIITSSDPIITTDAQIPNQYYIETLIAHYKKSKCLNKKMASAIFLFYISNPL